MICRVDLTSDPISLIIIAADGREFAWIDNAGQDGFVNVEFVPMPATVNPTATTVAQP